jgi:hypothetical protein
LNLRNNNIINFFVQERKAKKQNHSSLYLAIDGC